MRCEHVQLVNIYYLVQRRRVHRCNTVPFFLATPLARFALLTPSPSRSNRNSDPGSHMIAGDSPPFLLPLQYVPCFCMAIQGSAFSPLVDSRLINAPTHVTVGALGSQLL